MNNREKLKAWESREVDKGLVDVKFFPYMGPAVQPGSPEEEELLGDALALLEGKGGTDMTHVRF
jgi:dihydroxyacid dehydratase/phosphogluconate dehydratase